MSDILQGDTPQMVSSPASSSLGEFGRTPLGQFFGFGGFAERDDWKRGEQSADNALARSKELQAREFNFNASEAQKNRDWQEYMSNTAYQRAVQDMKTAGINPVLAYQQGGASTPSGFAAQGSSSSGPQGRGSSPRNSRSRVFSSIANIVAGAITGSAHITAASLASASATMGSSKREFKRDQKALRGWDVAD